MGKTRISIYPFVVGNSLCLCAVRFNGIDLVNFSFGRVRLITVITRRAINDVLTIRRPMWMNVIRFVIGHLMRLTAAGIDNINLIVPSPIGNEGDLFSVGRPFWSDVVRSSGSEAFLLTRFDVPDEDIGFARPAGIEGDPLSVRRPAAFFIV